MVELIVGKKGKGKTKVLLDRVNGAVKEANGSIVTLTRVPNICMSLTIRYVLSTSPLIH